MYIAKELSNLPEAELQRELEWLSVLQRLHVKSGDAWAHRRAILSRLPTKDIASELSFICDQAMRHPHHYYALNHFNWLSPDVSEEVANDFFKILLRTTPSHYGVYHHLLQRTDHWNLLQILTFVSEAVERSFHTSESFSQFVYVAVLRRPGVDPAPALAFLTEGEWHAHFRKLILEL